jgi:hypothetical protein
MKETKYEGYFVDTKGNVYSNKKGELRKLSQWLTSKGRYWTFRITGKNILVHRLMAETYLDNPDNLPEVNHKDHNSHNNELSNLEWCTRRENMQHGFAKYSPIRNFKECKVYNDGIYIGTYKSVAEASRIVSKTFHIPKSMLEKHRSYNGITLETDTIQTNKQFGKRGGYKGRK